MLRCFRSPPMSAIRMSRALLAAGQASGGATSMRSGAALRRVPPGPIGPRGGCPNSVGRQAYPSRPGAERRQANQGELPMIRISTIAIGLALTAFASGSFAQGTSCSIQSSEKKLAGAAKNSFMKKCETDAKAACSKEAGEKKLAGAAKNSFTKKCVTDAVGS